MTRQMVISATFDTALLEQPLKFWVKRTNSIYDFGFTLTDYNSIYAQLLSKSTEFSENTKGINFLLFTESAFSSNEQRVLFLESVETHLSTSSNKLFVIRLPDKDSTDNPVLGQLQLLHDRFESKFAVDVFDNFDDSIFDDETNALASIPFTEDFYTDLGNWIFRKFFINMTNSAFKVFVLDCDRTLWGRILNEVGVAALELNDSRKKLRKLLKAQVESGRLLCINSANDEQDVRAVFRTGNDNFVLVEDNVTAWKVNWKPKHENIRNLAEELNLGLDSFIFIDDDHSNIGICRQEVPEVLSLRFDCENSETFIENLWLLDKPDFLTKEDRDRGSMYKANLKRKTLEKANVGQYSSFLSKLEMKIDIRVLDSADVGRVSQLTQRSNRFNATTLRMTEAEVMNWDSDQRKCFVVDVSDKFGSYGLCGCMFVQLEDNCVEVISFVLSCRVLNRGVDFEMIRFLANTYQERTNLFLNFSASAKNNLIEEAFKKISILVEGERLSKGFSFSAQKVKLLSQEVFFSQERGTKKPEAKKIDNIDAFIQRNELLISLFENQTKSKPVKENRIIIDKGDALKTVRAVTEYILGFEVPQIQIKDTFMTLGMTSLQMVQFVASLRRSFPKQKDNIDISLPFNHPSILELATFIEESNSKLLQQPVKHVVQKLSVEIGISAMACRFPGGITNPVEFWNFLLERKNAKQKITRWSDNIYPSDCGTEVKFMHSLNDIATFDNKKFNISDAEARLMDPQQKMVLQVAYETLYRSNINLNKNNRDCLNRFRGERIGVFVALSQSDWPYIALEEKNKSTYSFSGKTASIASGRVSFTFGLTGPSLNVDTACSSSLVALNMAKQAVEDGDCSAALVIAVNLNLHPETFVQLSRARQLSKDGLCKAFDNKANGFARGEGCAAILLETIDQERTDILATLKSVSLNNDGFSSSLAAPNGKAQEDCLKRGLKKAGIEAKDIAFIETHGAGTKLGDAIEFQSIRTVFSERKNKLVLGALKTNIGHLEAGAGMAGIIKAVLVLLHSTAPPNLHLNEVNDCFNVSFPVDFAKEAVHLSKENSLCAGVSAFGMSGTNAFAVIEQVKTENKPNLDVLELTPPQFEPKKYSWKYLEMNELQPTANINVNECQQQNLILHSVKNLLLSIGITSFDMKTRFSELGLDSLAGIEFSQGLLDQYPALSEEYDATNLIYQLDTPDKVVSKLDATQRMATCRLKKRVGVVFTGQGSQYFGMGEELYQNCDEFKTQLDKVVDIFFDLTNVDLLDIMFRGNNELLVLDTKYAQIAIFAFEYALCSYLMKQRSISGDNLLLLGHSIGEFVAVTLSGMIKLDDAVRLVVVRGSSMSSCDNADGIMLAIRCDPETIKSLITEFDTNKIAVAAINGPRSTVLSGSSKEIAALVARLEFVTKKKMTKSQLKVSHAFHSPYMKAAISDFSKELDLVSFKKGKIPVISELLGIPIDEVSKDYWISQLMGCVDFYGAIKRMLEMGVTEIIEVGPQPKLVNLIQSIANHLKTQVNVTSIMKKDASEMESITAFFGYSKEQKSSSIMEVCPVEDEIYIKPKKKTKKFDKLYNNLFDESTLVKRMEDRLFKKLMRRWEASSTTADDSSSIETVSLCSKLSLSSYTLEESRGLVGVFDGENKLGKNDLLLLLEDIRVFQKSLLEHGAILIRNFGLNNAQDFKEVLKAFQPAGYQMRDYLDGISPRTEVLKGIYTSTEYVSNLDMALHNEMSYNPCPPDLIAFFCVSPPQPGTGRTPLASSEEVFKRLPSDIKTEFKKKGLRYIVNSPSKGKGAGVSWQQMYGTEDCEVVDRICSRLDVMTRWNKDGSLTTFRNASATRIGTRGSEVWFNHSHLFHPTDLPKVTQRVLKSVHGEEYDRYPKFCTFGDGSLIKPETLATVRKVQESCRVSFDWMQGDLLLIDNFQLCHGRQSFDKSYFPSRKILASMLFK